MLLEAEQSVAAGAEQCSDTLARQGPADWYRSRTALCNLPRAALLLLFGFLLLP